MRCAPLIGNFSCGLFIIPQDFQESSYDPATYFSDQPISFQSFNAFFCYNLGGKIDLHFQGLEVSRADKVISLIEKKWFRFNSSCYMNWNFFDHYQRENNMNPELHMCGSCWKCQIDIEMTTNHPSLSKLIKLRA